jgi:hypothetical protein
MIISLPTKYRNLYKEWHFSIGYILRLLLFMADWSTLQQRANEIHHHWWELYTDSMMNADE